MITNFEEITQELTEDEKIYIQAIIDLFKRTKDRPIKNKSISAELYFYRNRKVNIAEARVRKLIHFVRVNDLVPCLVSTSQGYFVSDDPAIVESCIKSLRERCNSINEVKNALEKQYHKKFNKGQIELF